MQRHIAVFIDWENIETIIKRNYKTDLLYKDFAEVLRKINQEKNIVAMYAYGNFDRGDFSLQTKLSRIGIEPKHVVTKSSYGVMQGAVDIELSLDMQQCLYENPHITDCMVVSGDGDIIHVLKRLRLKGKFLHVASFLDKTSNRLISMVDTFTDLTTYKQEFLKDTMSELDKKRAAALNNEWVQNVIKELTKYTKRTSMSFVGLNYFRNKLLDKYHYNNDLISEALSEAIELGIIETYTVPNPLRQSIPTTACKLHVENSLVSV